MLSSNSLERGAWQIEFLSPYMLTRSIVWLVINLDIISPSGFGRYYVLIPTVTLKKPASF